MSVSHRAIKQFRDTEVAQLYGVVTSEENVLGLEIPVEDLSAVNILDG